MDFYVFLDSRFRGNDSLHPASASLQRSPKGQGRGELLHSAKGLHEKFFWVA